MSDRSRLVSLDVFRGLTIVLMIIVNSPGNDTPYALLAHAAWNGCTLADLVFPWFIFIVGISAVLGLHAAQHAGVAPKQLWATMLKRSLLLFGLGLLLNAFPHHFNWQTIRILGVLQRLAICYLFSASLYLTTSASTQTRIGLGLIAIYTIILFQCGAPFIAHVDQLLLGSQHLYQPTYDPEGILSTLPCLTMVVFGNLIGYRLLNNHHHFLYTGILATSMGWLCSYWLPFNKALMTPSLVLWATGLGLVLFAGLYHWIEIQHRIKGLNAFRLFGQNALLIYVLHVLGLKLQALVHLRPYLTELLFLWASPPNAALLYALAYTSFWYVILVFVRKKMI
jgi:predicted acyltransferase